MSNESSRLDLSCYYNVTLTNNVASHILLKWNIQGKIMPFWPFCCESKAILSKKFRLGNPAGVFIRENLIFILVVTEDLGNPTDSPSHRNTETFTKEMRVRGGLGNQASPVNVAHKRGHNNR